MIDPCLRVLLCALGRPVLVALSQLIQAQVVPLEVLVAEYEALLVLLLLPTVPLLAVREAATTVIQTARSAVNIVPFSLGQNCPPLGSAMKSIDTSLSKATKAAQKALDDANSNLAAVAFTKARKKDAEAALASLRTLKTAIDDALTPQGCT